MSIVNFFRTLFFNSKNKKCTLKKEQLIFIKGLIGKTPTNHSIFHEALTHSSYTKDSYSNERMEYLGDSVINFIIATYLFEKYKDKTEGGLSIVRAYLSSRKHLSYVAGKIKLKKALNLGPSIKHPNTKKLEGDALEAFVSAIYLDQGIGKARQFIIKYIIEPYETQEAFYKRT